jgi:hypothetical protein
MQYLADEGTVIYAAKDGKDRKVFDAPGWLAAMCSHVPNPGEQMVRYYGRYIKSILNHLGLWPIGSRPRAKAHAPPVREYVADGSCSTGFPDNTSYGDPCYSWDAYITT